MNKESTASEKKGEQLEKCNKTKPYAKEHTVKLKNMDSEG